MAPRLAIVFAELSNGGFHILLKRERGAVVERMGERSIGLNVAQTVRCKRERAKEGRRDTQRVHRRSDVVVEAGKGDFSGSRRTANMVAALIDRDGDATLRQRDGGC